MPTRLKPRPLLMPPYSGWYERWVRLAWNRWRRGVYEIHMVSRPKKAEPGPDFFNVYWGEHYLGSATALDRAKQIASAHRRIQVFKAADCCTPPANRGPGFFNYTAGPPDLEVTAESLDELVEGWEAPE